MYLQVISYLNHYNDLNELEEKILVPILDFNNKIAISTTEFTTESSGCIYGGIRSNNASNGIY